MGTVSTPDSDSLLPAACPLYPTAEQTPGKLGRWEISSPCVFENIAEDPVVRCGGPEKVRREGLVVWSSDS